MTIRTSSNSGGGVFQLIIQPRLLEGTFEGNNFRKRAVLNRKRFPQKVPEPGANEGGRRSK